MVRNSLQFQALGYISVNIGIRFYVCHFVHLIVLQFSQLMKWTKKIDKTELDCVKWLLRNVICQVAIVFDLVECDT
jgi:hypothetical protein